MRLRVGIFPRLEAPLDSVEREWSKTHLDVDMVTLKATTKYGPAEIRTNIIELQRSHMTGGAWETIQVKVKGSVFDTAPESVMYEDGELVVKAPTKWGRAELRLSPAELKLIAETRAPVPAKVG